MKYTDQQRLNKILDYALKLQDYLIKNQVTKDMVLNDVALQWLVTTPLYNIVEHVYYLSDDFKSAHDDIQWSVISGLRHRLIHDYDGTNWNIIIEVLFDDLPVFVQQIKKLL